jgi:hypothetical protein
MRAVRLRETGVEGTFWGEDCRLYELVAGTEQKCCRCGRWAQAVFRWGQERACGAHFRLTTRSRIRLTTTFALRVYGEAGELPTGKVVRRGDEFAVSGAPRREGKFDRFELHCGGFVLVPRSRWAWA